MKNKIIIQHGMSFFESGGMQFKTGRIPNLNTKVMYWDGITNIKGGLAVMNDSPDILTLKKEGLFEDHQLFIKKSGSLTEIIADETKNIILSLLSDASTNYITDGISPSILMRSGMAASNGGALLNLTNALPMVDDSLNIDQILEFREKRGDMHRRLINHINSLELRVMSSEMPGLELKKAIQEIDTGCMDAISLYKESKIKFNLSNIKINFNMKEIIKITGSVYGGASLLLPQTGAIVAGVLAGAVSTFRWDDSVKIKKIDRAHPFNYIAEIQKSGFA